MKIDEAMKSAEGAPAAAAPRKPIQQTVVRELADVGKYRVRVVKPSGKPGTPAVLDVREYVKGQNYEGFTRKGVRLGRAEAELLRRQLDEVLARGELG